MTVSVIIPTIHAQPEMLARAKKLAEDTPGVLEVIVPEGGTFAENCDEGARRADGQMLVFLNDDCEPQPGWLVALTRPFVDDNTVGITGARLTYPTGKLQHAGIYFTTLEDGTIVANNHLTEQPSGYCDGVTAACMAIPRLLFEDLDGFDEGFRNGYEDVDLCLKTQLQGWAIWYCADSNVIHHESQSGPARWAHVNDNVQRLQAKWRSAKLNSGS